MNGHRPPSKLVSNWDEESPLEGIERRVCPNCRLYFDVGGNTDTVFCSKACEKRHNRGVYK